MADVPEHEAIAFKVMDCVLRSNQWVAKNLSCPHATIAEVIKTAMRERDEALKKLWGAFAIGADDYEIQNLIDDVAHRFPFVKEADSECFKNKKG